MTRLALFLFALQAASAQTTLVVRVVGPLGEPLRGVAVDLRRPDVAANRPRLTPRTGSDGRCRFHGLRAGRYQIAVRRFPGWSAEAHQTIEIGDGAEVVERTLRPDPARTPQLKGVVEGFAADRFGQPALFVQAVEQTDLSTPPGACLATLIRPDGSFRIRVPHAGRYQLYIDELSSGSRGCTGLRPTPARVVIGDEDSPLRLAPPAGFSQQSP